MDYLITGATVFDGLSVEPQQLTVGIEGEKIVYIGDPLTRSAAKRVIEAPGLYLCPGFIDSHASTGLGYMLPNAADHKLYQGVTTEIVGNCGTSNAPIGELYLSTMHDLAEQIGFAFTWRTLSEWFAQLEAHGLPFNIGTFVGHNTVRAGISGDSQQVTEREVKQMTMMLDQALHAGALGFSTGLVYTPGCFATTEEIIELNKVVAKHNGLYASHLRNEREGLETAIDEAIEIARVANTPVLISHLKAAEKPNWGKIPQVLQTIKAARAEGVSVYFDLYPYTATSTKLRTFIPKEALDQGVAGMLAKLQSSEWRQRCIDWLLYRQTDFDAMILISESIPGCRGQSVQQIADRQERTPAEMVVDLLLAEPDSWIVYECIAEQDMDAAILWHDSIICSDSWSYPVNALNSIGDPHPRTYGAFTRFLERYALTGRIRFGHAIRKMTSLPARRLNLPKRGAICEGYYADLLLLDPANVKEMATYQNPRQFSRGTEYVWVNGTLMLEDGNILPHLPGHIIRRPRD